MTRYSNDSPMAYVIVETDHNFAPNDDYHYEMNWEQGYDDQVFLNLDKAIEALKTWDFSTNESFYWKDDPDFIWLEKDNIAYPAWVLRTPSEFVYITIRSFFLEA